MSRFPPSGPTGRRSPSSSVLSRHYDFPPSVSRHFVSFVRRYHGLHSCFRSRAAGCHHASLELVPGISVRDVSVETTGSPKFLGNPNCSSAHALRLRRDGRSRPHDAYRVDFIFRAAARPPRGERQRLSQTNQLSKLNHMAFGLAVYASSRSLPRATQDSLPAVGQTLPDGLPTRRVTTRGFKFTSCQSSPSAKLLGAIPFISSLHFEHANSSQCRLRWQAG